MAYVLLASMSSALTAPTKTANLLAWMTAQPGGALGPVTFGNSKCGDGGGVFSSRAIDDGEALVSIPVSCIITSSLGGTAFDVIRAATGAEGERAALAAFIARQQLSPVSPFDEFLAVLPQRQADELHMLWWDESEVEQLTGSTALAECDSLRTEVDKVIARLSEGELSAEVAAHGQAAVAEAVRAAYVCVLSRCFTVPIGMSRSDGGFNPTGKDAEVAAVEGGEAGEGGDSCELLKALIPVLDLFQHGGEPSVNYAFEECPTTGVSLVVARSIGAHPLGTELRITYGASASCAAAASASAAHLLPQPSSRCPRGLHLRHPLWLRAAAAAAARLLLHHSALRRLRCADTRVETVPSLPILASSPFPSLLMPRPRSRIGRLPTK